MHIADVFTHIGCEGLTNEETPQVLTIDPVQVTRVFDRKEGDNQFGQWSFQDLGVQADGEKYYVKLENLPPAADLGIREGLTLGFAPTKSAKGGMKGIKVKEETRNGATMTRIYVGEHAIIKAGAKVLYGAPSPAAAPAPAARKPAPATPARKPAARKPAPPPEDPELTEDQQAYLAANPDDPQLIGYQPGWNGEAPAEPEAGEAPPPTVFDHEAGKYGEAGRQIGQVLKALAEEAGIQIVDVSVMTDAEPARLAAIAHQQGELCKLASTAYISVSGGRR